MVINIIIVILQIMINYLGLWTDKKLQKVKTIQGFITSKNRFVDRKEALIIAQNNNQVIGDIIGYNLYNENLY